MRLPLSIIFILCAIVAQSQTFLDNLRRSEAGKGKVSVVQSAEIDSLVNGTSKQQTPVTGTTSKKNGDAQHDPSRDNRHEDSRRDGKSVAGGTSVSAEDDAATGADNTVVDTRKKVMRNSYKTKGYRIQVYSGGNSRTDRQKAERAGADMKVYFPDEPVYVHFYSPSWKCRMGNYKTADEARELLSQVKALGYKQACLIRETISVPY